MANNISGEQAPFSAAQQLFSSSSDPKKQTCGISKPTYNLFQKQTYFPWGTREANPAKKAKFLPHCNRG